LGRKAPNAHEAEDQSRELPTKHEVLLLAWIPVRKMVAPEPFYNPVGKSRNSQERSNRSQRFSANAFTPKVSVA
jgi:hypothetical protein